VLGFWALLLVFWALLLVFWALLLGFWALLLGFWALLLVRVLAAGGSGTGGRRGWRPAVVERPRPGLLQDVIPLCPVMPELHIETFRAPVMIAGSFGLYLAPGSFLPMIMKLTEPRALVWGWHCVLGGQGAARPG
jgi:hypothetical protein